MRSPFSATPGRRSIALFWPSTAYSRNGGRVRLYPLRRTDRRPCGGRLQSSDQGLICSPGVIGGLKLMSEVKPKLAENRSLLRRFNSEMEVITEEVVESYGKCRLDHDQDHSFSLEAAIVCHDEVKRLMQQKVLEELEEAYDIGSKNAVFLRTIRPSLRSLRDTRHGGCGSRCNVDHCARVTTRSPRIYVLPCSDRRYGRHHHWLLVGLCPGEPESTNRDDRKSDGAGTCDFTLAGCPHCVQYAVSPAAT